MKITNISLQTKNPNRVNISVDGTYRFSLDIAQVIELGIKIGNEYSEVQLVEFAEESSFGKLYARALEYCLMRPHSSKEVRDYLWKKTRTTRYKSRSNGEIKEREGVSEATANRVYDRLVSKGYVDDSSFARYWVENRNQRKGTSMRKLVNELRAKGVPVNIIDETIGASDRDDSLEIKKIIIKKRARYPDDQKLIAYLLRQGFGYDDVRSALNDSASD